MPSIPVIFFIMAVIAVATAAGTVLSRNAIYSALFLVLNFATIALLYLILGAPFIALSQITVYAGSIMVLFLFVIMLLGAERLSSSESLRWQPYVAVPLGVLLAIAFAYNLFRNVGPLAEEPQITANYGAPAVIGEMLFTQYALPFEITGLILLSAVIGAVILARPDKPISPGEQIRRLDASVPTPAGAPSGAEKEVPAAVQEEAMGK